MKKRMWIYTSVIAYFLLTMFFFVQNVLIAKDGVSLEEMVNEEKIVDYDQRAILRAYYTAPPVIPHDVENRDPKDCLRCHLNVTKLDDGRVAMKTPHPQFYSCVQCHVINISSDKKKESNRWQGLKEPKRGDRWVTLSPPTIPHRLFLRENCLSCHGPDNPDTKMRTTHPERTSCLQCHVPNVNNQF